MKSFNITMFVFIIFFFVILFSQRLELACGGKVVNHSDIRCLDTERRALLEFKQNLIDDSTLLSTWIGDDCCTWYGVSCSMQTRHVLKLNLRNPVMLNDKFIVADLQNYSRNCLRGEISKSLLNLEQLSYLDLSLNNFSGTQIPEFLGSLKNLRYLNLSCSYFTGLVPHHLGNLSRLQYLDLHQYNLYYGNVLKADSLLWASKLSSLKHLDLNQVDLSNAKDWFLAVNMLPSLLVLNLGSCGLVNIPPRAHINFMTLVSLDLSNNQISASMVPHWLSNITGLMILHLQWNSYDGPVPESIGLLKFLTFLDLSYNSFDTLLPDSLSKLRNLVHLDLSFNEFQGAIPTQILNNHTQLRTLDLSYNKFQGSVPTEISNLGQLRNLFLSENKFQVSIPTEIGNLTKLTNIDLRDNKFRGSIPIEMGNLVQLRYLDIHDNELTGNLPTSFQNLVLLKELDVSNNQLTGTIPPFIGQLSELEKLNLYGNSMSGSISETHFKKLRKLKDFILSSKADIVLNFSTTWTPPFQLQVLKLITCKVGPQFPVWLRNQRQIEELVISDGKISDLIPNWFENIYSHVTRLDLSHNQIRGNWFENLLNSSVTDLDLSYNQLTGKILSIPSNLETLDLSSNLLSGLMIADDGVRTLLLQSLFLSNNQLTGDVPPYLCNMGTLKYIVLSENHLSGKLPSCLGSLQNLEVLDVTNNTLSGLIPRSLEHLQSLTSLHLHDNKFHGTIPSSFKHLTSLVTLDLGENDITGVIPAWIGENLSNLRFLSLQFNRFNGIIPPQLCRLSNLQLLNLGHNNITGSIPSCFGNFTAMIRNHSADEYFNVFINFIIHDFQGEKILDSMKGTELEYSTTLPFLTSIDLSDNKIVGEIPEDLMGLVGLRSLNVAGNIIEGRIPEKIGNLIQLVSLDLSRNKLHGPIPQSLSNLSFLSHLNLSFNDLSGRIPSGYQLQTLNDPSIYMGNRELCGSPSLNKCSDDRESSDQIPVISNDKDDNDRESLWIYAGTGPGLLVGFLAFCGALHFNKTWRYAYFQFIEEVYDKLVVAIALKRAWLCQKFRKSVI